jgi:hypothetical protein
MAVQELWNRIAAVCGELYVTVSSNCAHQQKIRTNIKLSDDVGPFRGMYFRMK